ncbi:MAG: hypothetical protein V4461_08835 [Pseudomonadota bacterium]
MIGDFFGGRPGGSGGGLGPDALIAAGMALTPESYFKRSDADYTASFLRAWEKKPGVPIFMPGDYPTKLTGIDKVVDQDIILFGPGRFVQSPGFSAMTIERSIGAAISVASVLRTSTVSVTTSNSDLFGDVLYKVVPAAMAGIVAHQKYMLSSLDELPFGPEATVGKKIFNNQIIEVRALALDYSGGSAFTEDTEVQGASSGAKMVIRSAFGVATGVLFGTSVTPGPGNTMFINGETLNVAGSPKATLAAAPYFVTKQKIYYDFTASPEIRQISSAKFHWDGPGIAAIGDQDAVIGAANRKTAIDTYGILNPHMRYYVDSAYSRAVMFTSAWMGKVKGYVHKLPNDATTGERAYGYGVDFGGASFGTKVAMYGGNCRHMESFTPWEMDSASANALNIYKRGVSARLSFTGRGVNTHSATWDCHEGLLDSTWNRCIAIRPSNGKRLLTQCVGFQDRGFGSTFINGEIVGAAIGIYALHRVYTNGLPEYTSRYAGNKLLECGAFGVADYSDAAAIGNQKILIDGNEISGDGLYNSSPWSGNQSGVFVDKLGNVEVTDNKFSKIRDSMIRLRGNGIYYVSGGKMDFTGTPAGVACYPVRIDDSPTITLGRQPEIINGTNTPLLQPPSLVRNAGTGTPTVTILSDPIVSGRGSPLPLLLNTSTGAAVLAAPAGRKLRAKQVFNPPSVAAGASTTVALGYAQFMGYMATNGLLTVTSAVTGKALEIGMPIVAPNMPTGAVITVVAPSGAGTYTVSPAPTAAVGSAVTPVMFQSNPQLAGLLVADASDYMLTASYNGDIGAMGVQAYVSANQTVTARFTNLSGSAIDLASGVLVVEAERLSL